jgi:phospholipid transport system transporter-binding protein
LSASVVPAAAVVIALPERVTRADVARLWRELGPRAATAARIELAGVREIDSAGVALVLELAAAGAAIDNAPPRYVALAAAHRVEGPRP